MKKYIKILLLSLVLILCSCSKFKTGGGTNYYREYMTCPCYGCGYHVCACGSYHSCLEREK